MRKKKEKNLNPESNVPATPVDGNVVKIVAMVIVTCIVVGRVSSTAIKLAASTY